MLFDEKPKVDPQHPLYWLEEKIVSNDIFNGNHNNEHANEHEDMKKHWNMPENANLIMPPAPHKEEGNRCYHIMLHLKYWKELGINLEEVKRYEENFEDKLEEIPVPNKTVHGESY